ncbi:MAG: DegT/DnrJ/EryC1/StrS family aminotransferase [Thaumarchaeota archaeon]|nr:DegT/DnrJ/EryC1/StrS family aminotransferase [Nitrososphaerota archaeon]MBI3641317.1 DegT/DnrJ/EryC1/StrS family aminotransferase [Nitrososphaerota archaeon]
MNDLHYKKWITIPFYLLLHQITNVLIKLFDPHISNLEINAAMSVIKSKFWASGSGINNVKKFEESFTKYTGSKNCVAVNSGTAALYLALSLFNIKNKEVLVPSLTFVSTVHSIIYNGGIPVFVEIEPKTACIDINDLKMKLSPRTGAIIPVHFGGIPCNLQELKAISKKHSIPIIEDAAHAAGASYHKKKIGSHSEAVCFSFHPVKNLAMPTGGAICLNGDNSNLFKEILNSMRWCGIEDRKEYNYEVGRLGWNYYMNEISAAIGLIQLKKLDRLNKVRRKISKRYFKELNLENKMFYSEDCAFHFYWIRVKNRAKFMKKMKEKGIETGIHYKPVHLMRYYKSNTKLPITEKIGSEIVSLPTHPNLTEKDVDRIIFAVNKLQE